MTKWHGIPITHFEANPSACGKFCLLTLAAETPGADGYRFGLAVPTNLLSRLAAACMKIRQPVALSPPLLSVRTAELTRSPNDQIILTLTTEQGAALSFEVDLGAAHSIAWMMGQLLGLEVIRATPKANQVRGGQIGHA